MKIIKNKENCKNCPLYDCSVIPDYSDEECDILVVAPHPLPEGSRYSNLFYGVGLDYVPKFITKAIKALSSRKLNVEYGFALNCRVSPNTVSYTEEEDIITGGMTSSRKNNKFKIKKDWMNSCNPNLSNLIDTKKPKIIIAMGIDSIKACGIKSTSVGAVRGSIREGYNGVRVISAHNPYSTLVGKPGTLHLIYADILRAVAELQPPKNKENFIIKYPEDFDGIKKELELFEAYCKVTQNPAIAIDTETNTVEMHKDDAKMIALSIAYSSYYSFAVPYKHKDSSITEEQRLYIKTTIERIIRTYKVRLIGHNYKFDYKVLVLREGFDLPKPSYDTMLLEHYLNEDAKGEYDLKTIVKSVPALYEYSNYEEELQDILESIKENKKKAAKKVFTAEEDVRYEAWLSSLKEYENMEDLMLYCLEYDEEAIRTIQEKVVLREKLMSKSTFDTMGGYKLRRTKLSKMKVPSRSKKILSLLKKALKESTLHGYKGLYRHFLIQKGIILNPKQIVQPTYEEIPLSVMLRYAAMDTLVTYNILKNQVQVHLKYDKETEKPLQGTDMYPSTGYKLGYNVVDLPLATCLAEMEYNGVKLDVQKGKEWLEILGPAIEGRVEELKQVGGASYNPSSSSSDSTTLLFDTMGLPILARTDSGAPSTEISVLMELVKRYPDKQEFIHNLIDYRQMEKVKGTYLEPWVQQGNNGRVHCNFNQTGTATFRLSSSKPNLQNIPKNFKVNGETYYIKDLLIPDSEDYTFVEYDISNAEMRVLAWYSGDDNLIKVFNDNLDMHCMTASLSFGIPYDEFVEGCKTDPSFKQLRQIAKTVNFGTVYCMSSKKLISTLYGQIGKKITPTEAEEYLVGFFKAYPKVKTFMDFMQSFVKNNRFIPTKFGRKRRFPSLLLDPRSANSISRKAVNTPIQSTSSDFVNLGILTVHDKVKQLGDNCRVSLTVHDSGLIQVPKGTTLESIKPILQESIHDTIHNLFPDFPVDWAYDYGIGDSYYKAAER